MITNTIATKWAPILRLSSFSLPNFGQMSVRMMPRIKVRISSLAFVTTEAKELFVRLSAYRKMKSPII